MSSNISTSTSQKRKADRTTRMDKDLTSQRLGLAARSIDLASTVIKSSDLDLVSLVAQASTKAATEIVKWLARERISEEAFVYTMRLGQNFAQPNLNGLQVLDRLEQTSSRLYGLHLIMPGALGRTLLYDEQLRWVSTTEAVILKYHPPVYAVEALCDLFVTVNLEENDPKIPAVKARIRPVISKMVDSLHLHTVNMGQEAQPLPACLESLPKHYLADFSLASAIRTLQAMGDSDILVHMNCCVVELLDWIFHHWTGKLTISVNNEILFDEQLGDLEHKLTMLIENECTADTDCHDDEHVRGFKIGYCVDSSFKMTGRVHEGITDPGIGCQNESSYRSSLYDIRNPFQSRHCYLSEREQKAAERYAQEIVRSILELPVSPIDTQLGFRVDKNSKIKFRFWLKMAPSILQKNLSTTTDTRLLFEKARPVQRGEDDDIQYTTGQVAQWYPEIHSGLKMAYERCQCGCNADEFMDNLDRELDSGCLLALMLSEMTLHIAHAMAEAAGASDVSNLEGISSATSLSEATVALLCSIADYGEIRWDTWFRLAASAITGLPYDAAREETVDVGGGILLWVAGCMTIAPAWFKLDSKIKLEGSWGVQQLKGSLQGLGAETAVIESQCSSFATPSKIPPQMSTSGGEDGEDVQIESAVFSNTGELYRIISMVRTRSALRILNPINVYHGAILAVRPSCAHEMTGDVTVHPWSLNDVTLGWNSLRTPGGDFPHIALLGNSPTKQNVAIGYTEGRCILQDGNCCFRCLADTAKKKDFYGIFCGVSSQKKLRFR